VILALGGGGARGLSHLGVLEVLEREDIPVVGLAGTSAGALVGAMWLALGSAAAAVERWREFLASDYPDSLPDVSLSDRVSSRDNVILHYARRLRQGAAVLLALERRNLVEVADFERAVAFLLPEERLERLRLPFAAVVTDFATGEPATLVRGPLVPAVAASCAVPGVVSPFRIGSGAFVDGGVVADVPVRQAAALGRRPVVAVAVGEALADEDPADLTVPRALLRAGIMTHEALRAELLRDAGLCLRPEVGHLHWSDFRRLDEALAAGRTAAEASLAQLRRLSRSRGTARVDAVPPSTR